MKIETSFDHVWLARDHVERIIAKSGAGIRLPDVSSLKELPKKYSVWIRGSMDAVYSANVLLNVSNLSSSFHLFSSHLRFVSRVGVASVAIDVPSYIRSVGPTHAGSRPRVGCSAARWAHRAGRRQHPFDDLWEECPWVASFLSWEISSIFVYSSFSYILPFCFYDLGSLYGLVRLCLELPSSQSVVPIMPTAWRDLADTHLTFRKNTAHTHLISVCM